MYAFRILNSLLLNCPVDAMKAYVPVCMQMLLHKLQDASRDMPAPRGVQPAPAPECANPKYVFAFLHLLCAYACRHGGAAAVGLLDSLQPGLIDQLATNVWGKFRSHLTGAGATSSADLRSVVAGLARILCDSPVGARPGPWAAFLACAADMGMHLLSQGGKTGAAGALQYETGGGGEEDDTIFDSAFSKLVYCTLPPRKETAEVASAVLFFTSELRKLFSSRPGQYTPVLHALPADSQAALQAMCQQTGVALV
jgi:hypothetical protein